MNSTEILKHLRSCALWKQVPEDGLSSLSEYFAVETVKDGELVFEEGAKGGSLYSIVSGYVLIRKKIHSPEGTQAYKELALLGPGQHLGEMSLFEKTPRSAQARASGDCVLLRLKSEDLSRWIGAHLSFAVDFLTELNRTMAHRLYVASKELTLLFDISQQLLEPSQTSRELIQTCLRHLLPHLEGEWSVETFLYNEFNAEFEFLELEEENQKTKTPPSLPAAGPLDDWIDDHSYRVVLPGEKRPKGYFIFRRDSALTREEKEQSAILFSTAARLIAASLENFTRRNEENLKSRLSAHRSSYESGF